jgi:hypothetical protein
MSCLISQGAQHHPAGRAPRLRRPPDQRRATREAPALGPRPHRRAAEESAWLFHSTHGPPSRHPLRNRRSATHRGGAVARCGRAPEPHRTAHEPPPRDLLDHHRAHPGGKSGAPHAAGASATANLAHPQATSQTAAESSRRTQTLSFGELRAAEKRTQKNIRTGNR